MRYSVFALQGILDGGAVLTKDHADRRRRDGPFEPLMSHCQSDSGPPVEEFVQRLVNDLETIRGAGFEVDIRQKRYGTKLYAIRRFG